ncbi:hypothetical protein NDU88_003785 [Pleurodeles waltl]|uniref:Uncharacterized protein n=1 Tax=Pleurodeles waltl TaxID=8319 RepID=A0AAV7VE95_PLEWA|nr:hypothetical protein NDU88_003785 [Pleurodeles waltl]
MQAHGPHLDTVTEEDMVHDNSEVHANKSHTDIDVLEVAETGGETGVASPGLKGKSEAEGARRTQLPMVRRRGKPTGSRWDDRLIEGEYVEARSLMKGGDTKETSGKPLSHA